jgi:Ca2+-binding EF-hand superfamily protein
MEKLLKTLGFASALAVVCLFSQVSAGRAATAVQTFDTDHDGTVDINEVKNAASTMFDRLDRDHDRTLDARELRGRLNVKQLAAANPDHDGTLTKDEYLAVVEKRFKAADSDGAATLDSKELKSRSGRALYRLLK